MERKKIYIGVIVTCVIAVCFGYILSLVVVPREKIAPACTEDIGSIVVHYEAVSVGNAYFGEGPHYDIRCAERAYARALEIDAHKDPLPWYQLGRIHFIQGDFEAAIYRFDTMIRRFGTTTIPNVHYMLGLTYAYRAHQHGALDDWKRAEEEFSKFSTVDPKSPWARVDLAWVLFSQKKYEAMKSVLEDALVSHPENPWVLNMYGLAQLNTNDKEGAKESFSKAEASLTHISPDEWGRVYPGNDPVMWRGGLEEMKELIKKNKEMTSS